MATNNPQIEAYLVTRIKGKGYGKPRKILDAEVYDPTSDGFFIKGAKENYTVEPLVLLSEYERLLKHLQSLIDQTTPLEPIPGNPMWSRRIQLDEVIAERDKLHDECEELVEALSALRGCVMETRGPDAHSALVLADAALAAHHNRRES